MKKLLLTVSMICLAAPAMAQDIVPTPDWNAKLTKDWDGTRQSLADKGIIVEMNATHITARQELMDSGISTAVSNLSLFSYKFVILNDNS